MLLLLATKWKEVPAFQFHLLPPWWMRNHSDEGTTLTPAAVVAVERVFCRNSIFSRRMLDIAPLRLHQASFARRSAWLCPVETIASHLLCIFGSSHLLVFLPVDFTFHTFRSIWATKSLRVYSAMRQFYKQTQIQRSHFSFHKCCGVVFAELFMVRRVPNNFVRNVGR